MKISSLTVMINIACKLTPKLLYLSNLEINACFTNVFSILDVPVINLFFSFLHHEEVQRLDNCFRCFFLASCTLSSAMGELGLTMNSDVKVGGADIVEVGVKLDVEVEEHA